MRIPATITSIARQTPTIKSFDLDLGGRELGFKPGQWVDFFVSLEGAEAVGGYSITSSPSVQDSIGLAIKLDEGDHPVTNWLHREARVGDTVEISLGGDFYYTPDMDGPIVLIAGGIGLTPLMSIVRAIDEDPIAFDADHTHLQRVHPVRDPLPPGARGHRWTQL